MKIGLLPASGTGTLEEIMTPDEIVEKFRDLAEDRDYFESEYLNEQSARGIVETRASGLQAELDKVNDEISLYQSQAAEAKGKAEAAENMLVHYRSVDSDIAKYYRGEEKIKELEGKIRKLEEEMPLSQSRVEKYTKIKEDLHAGDENVLKKLTETIADAEAYRSAGGTKQRSYPAKRFVGLTKNVLTALILTASVGLTIGGMNLRGRNRQVDEYQQKYQQTFEVKNNAVDKDKKVVNTGINKSTKHIGGGYGNQAVSERIRPADAGTEDGSTLDSIVGNRDAGLSSVANDKTEPPTGTEKRIETILPKTYSPAGMPAASENKDAVETPRAVRTEKSASCGNDLLLYTISGSRKNDWSRRECLSTDKGSDCMSVGDYIPGKDPKAKEEYAQEHGLYFGCPPKKKCCLPKEKSLKQEKSEPAGGSLEPKSAEGQPDKQPSAPPNSGTPPAEKPAGRSLSLEPLPLPEERNTSNNEGDK